MKVLNTIAVFLVASVTHAAHQTLNVPLLNNEGKQVGSATLVQLKNGVKISVAAKGVTAGEHAVHIHENGVCRAPDFKSAGDHFNPKKKKHGFDVVQGPHAGDIPNLIANDQGVIRAEVINSRVSLKKNAKNSLLKKGGTALVIHSRSDDYRGQPAGNAGDRLICGEINKEK